MKIVRMLAMRIRFLVPHKCYTFDDTKKLNKELSCESVSEDLLNLTSSPFGLKEMLARSAMMSSS